jgi:DNA-binding transcriptional LysR family regulator
VDPKLLPDIIVFLEVVRSGSFTRAAERLHTVQSNVTARIKKLEGALGVTLLKRHARGVKATPAGEATLALAVRMNSVLEDLRFTFGQGRGSIAQLRIGAIETVLATHLPRLVAQFLRGHPHVQVSIHAASSSTILRQIRDGELDAGFVSRAPTTAGVREELIWSDELVIVAPPQIKDLGTLLSKKHEILKILVQRLGCSYTERMIAVLMEKAPRTYSLLELGTLEGVLGFVEVGFGIAAMPRSFIQSLSRKRAFALIDLPLRARKLATYLITPAAEHSPAVVEKFIQFCGGKTAHEYVREKSESVSYPRLA